MSVWDRKTKVLVGTAIIEVPDILTSGGEPIDSDAAYLQGDGLSIVIDQGPFSDPLTTYGGRPEYREAWDTIAALPARVISYRDPDEATDTVGAHIPDLNRLTVVVRATDAVPKGLAFDIIRSIHRQE